MKWKRSRRLLTLNGFPECSVPTDFSARSPAPFPTHREFHQLNETLLTRLLAVRVRFFRPDDCEYKLVYSN